jgi:hypothetical protein
VATEFVTEVERSIIAFPARIRSVLSQFAPSAAPSIRTACLRTTSGTSVTKTGNITGTTAHSR